MKRFVRLAVLSLIFFVVPVLPVFRASSAVSAAGTPAGKTVSASPTATPTPTPAPIEYALPYPGILPDNPLYVLKNVRDRIIELLISDPVNKTEFYILQADKKLNMAVTLVSLGKNSAAETMLSESETARAQAVDGLAKMEAAGKQVPGYVIEKLTLSLRKHEEVLAGLRRPTDAVVALMKKVAAIAGGK